MIIGWHLINSSWCCRKMLWDSPHLLLTVTVSHSQWLMFMAWKPHDWILSHQSRCSYRNGCVGVWFGKKKKNTCSMLLCSQERGKPCPDNLQEGTGNAGRLVGRVPAGTQLSSPDHDPASAPSHHHEGACRPSTSHAQNDHQRRWVHTQQTLLAQWYSQRVAIAKWPFFIV